MNDDRIIRDVDTAPARRFDLIVIGGGIYGVCVALESARRGLKPLLLERDDFGGATSWNSLRIVHGGLRYLQSLDLTRVRESAAERRFFVKAMPGLVRPLRCLMPLYGKGLRRPSTFRWALRLNAWLARDPDWPAGQVISASETAALFPAVRTDRLAGGGVWFDAILTHPQRVLIELLRAACSLGATALNYVEAGELIVENGHVSGVVGIDRTTGCALRLRAPIVVNCAGPWCREIATRLDRDQPNLLRPQIACNLLLDRPPVSDAAVAVTPDRPGARTYFLVPWGHRVLAGTYHAPRLRTDRIALTDEQLDEFVGDLNEAVPALDADRSAIVRLYAGVLPARAEGSVEMAKRPVVLDHARVGGPSDLWSLSGIKYTTARLVAQRWVGRVWRQLPPPVPLSFSNSRFTDALDAESARRIVAEEAVVHMDDLLLRRGDWSADPSDAAQLALDAANALRLTPDQRSQELKRLERLLNRAAPARRVRVAPPVPVPTS